MRSISALVCLLSAGAAWAGSAPVSTSTVDGYFLANGNEAYLPANLSNDLLKALKATCASAGPIWMLGREAPVQCTGLKYIEEAGNGPAYQVMMSAPESNSRTSLFSIHPFGRHRWVTRAPTDQERSAVLGLLSNASGYEDAMSPARSKDIRAIDSPTRAWTLFIAPWTTDVDEENFGISNPKFLVINGVDGHYEIAGELSGTLGSLVDINADGAPEIQVSTGCDGVCEYIESLYPAVEIMVSIAVH
jgi:hypothetical protein